MHRSRLASLALFAALAPLAGCAGDLTSASPNTGRELKPACLAPAPLLGSYDPAAPGVIVQFNDGVDPNTETSRLAARYDFTPKFVYTVIPGFAATLSDPAIAAVRCERTVKFVEHDAVMRID